MNYERSSVPAAKTILGRRFAGRDSRGVVFAFVALGLAPGIALGNEPAAPLEPRLEQALHAFAETGPEGKGAKAAREAYDLLSKSSVEILPRLLESMEDSRSVANNWRRAVYERIVEREWSSERPEFPLDFLREFTRSPKRSGKARRMTLALLDRLEPAFRDSLIPTLLDDPEFRNDAVEAALRKGEVLAAENRPEAARVTFRAAFEHARDDGQVVRAAERLRGMGEEADIVSHFGFVVDWRVVGPFAAPEFSGFEKSFPPEENHDRLAHYKTAEGADLTWKALHSSDPLGQLNLNESLGASAEAVGYAYTEIDSPRDLKAQLRCSADDNLTVWLNGEKVFSRRQWLNGTRLDRFAAPVELRAGVNRVLVKVCQGPRHKDPEVPNNWTFQLRFCDDSGAGLGLTTREIDMDSKR